MNKTQGMNPGQLLSGVTDNLMNIQRVTESNLLQHPQAICFINPKHPEYHLKVDWLKERFREGMVIKLLYLEGEKRPAGFIEYVPEGSPRFRIMAQRISATGVPLWGDQGKELLPFVEDTMIAPFQAASLSDGSSVVIWTKRHVTIPGDVIYAMRVDSTGSLVWDPPFTILSDTLSAKDDLSLSSFINGEAVLVWGDARKDTTGGVYEISDIMAQNILETGKTGPLSIQEPAPLARNTLSFYPNPAISGVPVEVRFNGEPDVRIVVFDALGHPVSLSPDVTRCAHGSCTALIQTTAMKPALYTIVVTSAKQTAAGKLIILQ